MKKILLSLAVVAASGAYVVHEHSLAPDEPAEASAAIAPPLLRTTPTQEAVPALSGDEAPAAFVTADKLPDPVVQNSPPAEILTSQTSNSAFSKRKVVIVQPDQVQPLKTAKQKASSSASLLSFASAIPGNVLQYSRPVAVKPKSQQIAAGQTTYRDGTYKGLSADAYYGRVQVAVVIHGGNLVSVQILDYPRDRRTSRYINSQALPVLRQEAIQAQSAKIDVVSGATLTSHAYRKSLDAALSAARVGGKNA